jgi:hypothetical protein
LIQEREGKWEDALDNWRKFTKGLKTGSYYWYESRYRTANALNHLGKDDEACEVINVMKVLHPQLRDDQFREKFTKLEKDICERKGD